MSAEQELLINVVKHKLKDAELGAKQCQANGATLVQIEHWEGRACAYRVVLNMLGVVDMSDLRVDMTKVKEF